MGLETTVLVRDFLLPGIWSFILSWILGRSLRGSGRGLSSRGVWPWFLGLGMLIFAAFALLFSLASGETATLVLPLLGALLPALWSAYRTRRSLLQGQDGAGSASQPGSGSPASAKKLLASALVVAVLVLGAVNTSAFYLRQQISCTLTTAKYQETKVKKATTRTLDIETQDCGTFRFVGDSGQSDLATYAGELNNTLVGQQILIETEKIHLPLMTKRAYRISSANS